MVSLQKSRLLDTPPDVNGDDKIENEDKKYGFDVESNEENR